MPHYVTPPVQIEWIAIKAPRDMEVDSLYAGEVGLVAANIKEVKDARVGDTITGVERAAESPLPG